MFNKEIWSGDGILGVRFTCTAYIAYCQGKSFGTTNIVESEI